MSDYTLLVGDCREVMAGMDAESVDAVVADPPYGLGFMGRDWDHGVPGEPFWREALRVAKPGAHLLAFGGTRTFHRLAVAIEDAGWEIRDTVMWVYGSGFPKSHDVSKAIDKTNGEVGRLHKFTAWMRTTGLKSSEINRITETNMGGHYLTSASQPAIPTAALWEKLRPHCGDVPEWVDELVQRIEAEREVVGKHHGTHPVNHINASNFSQGAKGRRQLDITAPATPEARQWQGWGTALKPAWEPIILARKPFKQSVAANVLAHGTGAINVDGCRVGTEEALGRNNAARTNGTSYVVQREAMRIDNSGGLGRFPANLILSYPENEYILRDDVTPEQLHQLAEWMNENAKH